MNAGVICVVMSPIVAFAILPVLGGAGPTADEILASVAKSSAMRHQAVYSGSRQYSIQNLRFGKSASVKVHVTAQPSKGKQFTIVQRSGSTQLIDVVESLISSEAEASKPANAGGHAIGPSNYQATLNGSETMNGHDCWVLSLKPKEKNKYVLNGMAWVDKRSYALVRLEGTTAARVSFWVGSPHIVEEFSPVDGIWFPTRTWSKSHSAFLGVSELDIQYTEYDVKSAPKTADQGHTVEPVQDKSKSAIEARRRLTTRP
jgi:hypothetical protein